MQKIAVFSSDQFVFYYLLQINMSRLCIKLPNSIDSLLKKESDWTFRFQIKGSSYHGRMFTLFRQGYFKVVYDFRHNAFDFVERKLLSNAIAWTSREWNVIERILIFHWIFGQKPFWLEHLRIFKDFFVAIHRVNWNKHICSARNDPIFS